MDCTCWNLLTGHFFVFIRQGNKKTLVNYFDFYKKEVLPSKYGRCDREVKCNYHLNPYKDGYLSYQTNKNNIVLKNSIKNNNFSSNRQIEKSPFYFDLEVYKKALNPERFVENTFLKNLINLQKQSSFFIEELFKVVDIYKIGTVTRGNWKGAVTFPFIDLFGNIRTVQVKKFDNNNKTIATNKLDKVRRNSIK